MSKHLINSMFLASLLTSKATRQGYQRPSLAFWQLIRKWTWGPDIAPMWPNIAPMWPVIARWRSDTVTVRPNLLIAPVFYRLWKALSGLWEALASL